MRPRFTSGPLDRVHEATNTKVIAKIIARCFHHAPPLLLRVQNLKNHISGNGALPSGTGNVLINKKPDILRMYKHCRHKLSSFDYICRTISATVSQLRTSIVQFSFVGSSGIPKKNNSLTSCFEITRITNIIWSILILSSAKKCRRVVFEKWDIKMNEIAIWIRLISGNDLRHFISVLRNFSPQGFFFKFHMLVVLPLKISFTV